MNHFIDGFRKEEQNIEYCCYCFTPRAGKIGCCSENHWVEYKDLDDDTQQRIAQEEYEWNNHKDQK